MMISTQNLGAPSNVTARKTAVATETKSSSIDLDKSVGSTKSDSASISTNGKKDFQTVANEAREFLNSSYQNNGKSSDIHTTSKEWDSILKGMDRRSLYAIASNAGGQFSEAEQVGAADQMEKQFQAAQGIDANNSASIVAFQGNMPAATKAGIAFLDSVSDEEKQSVGWAANRASMQNFYSIVASKDGQQPEDVESDNPLVKVLASAMKASRGDPARDRSEGRMDTLEGLKNQPWAKGFEAQIDQASRAVAKQGSLVDRTV